eukprot:TRINITY_DN81696_c0_g1_i1.p1 TRINITY_DN81696_c0_g1~~TRINITY_DN81696_c0_g1_i1.p1  ORF type:complete len:321 (-),score=27.02 TRINITY_DN81696_c0_g1_i1:40-1002(-)
MVCPEIVIGHLSKLLADEDSKDLEIEMSDGTIRAHSLMLIAGSDAVRGLLKQASHAGASCKKLSWKEWPVDVGRFFLRLLYTGDVNEQEWGLDDQEDALPSRLIIVSPNEYGDVCGGEYSRDLTTKPNSLGYPLWKKSGADRWLYAGCGADGRLWWCMCGAPVKDEGFTGASGIIHSVLSSTSEDFAKTPLDVNTWKVWKDGAWHDDRGVKVTATQRCPLRMLCQALQLAKMFLFQDLLGLLVESLEDRLSPETFNSICAAAIKADSTPLRLKCVAFAMKPYSQVRPLFDSGELAPEVLAELEGTWGRAAMPETKKRRLL